MPAKPRIDVFISSTSNDLKEYREAAIAICIRFGFHPIAMEYFTSMPSGATAGSIKKLDEAELYVGIFAHRYGYIEDPADGRSVTEIEFDHAGTRGLDRLCFVVDPKFPWPPEFTDHANYPKLEAFKAKVGKLIRAPFTSVDDFRVKLTQALTEWREANLSRFSALPCNRVPKPPVFAGRADQIAELDRLLDGTGAVAITAVRGAGGIGKTTLAQHYAHARAERFGLKLWAEFGKEPGENILTGILNRWCGQELDPAQPLGARLDETQRRLTAAMNECDGPPLVIFDDVWPGTVDLARALLKALPDGYRLLVTTRSQEVVNALKARGTTLAHLPPDEGAEVLIAYLKLDEGAAPERFRGELAQLSDSLGGHPLALSLAARRLRGNLTARGLARLTEQTRAGIESGQDFKDLHLDEADQKEDSVSYTLNQTLTALSSDERGGQFRGLGVLPPNIAFRAAHAAAIWELDADAAEEALAELVNEGLLSREVGTDDLYRQHRLLRAYARALLQEDEDAFTDADARGIIHVINWAGSIFVDKYNHPETWGDLTADLPQIHALGDRLTAVLTGSADPAAQDAWLDARAQAFLSDTPDPILDSLDENIVRAVLEFGVAIYWYIYLRYVGAEGRRWLWSGLAAASRLGDQQRQGLFANQVAEWLRQRGYLRESLLYHEAGLRLAEALGNKGNQSAGLSNIGLVRNSLGEPRQALDYFLRSLTIAREISDRRGEAATLTNIGLAWHNLDELTKALQYYQQALTICREADDRRGEATALSNIGGVWNDLGEPRKALDCFEQTLPIQRVANDRHGEAATLNNIGYAWHNLDEPRKALDYFEQALPIRHEVGDRVGEAATLCNIGGSWLAMGELRKALDYFKRALVLHTATEDRSSESVTRGNIAFTLWALGDHARALQEMQTARDLKAAMGLSTADEDLKLAEWRGEPIPPATLPTDFLQQLGDITVAALTTHTHVREKVRTTMVQQRSDWVEQGADYLIEVELADALLALLAEQPAVLPPGHSYAEFLAGVVEAVEQWQQGQGNPSDESSTPVTLPQETLQPLGDNTVAVLTVIPNKREEWKEQLEQGRATWVEQGADYQIEVELADGLLALLAGKTVAPPPGHPYAEFVAGVVKAVEEWKSGQG